MIKMYQQLYFQEFNDDDFRQQGSPHKKTANGSTDQIYKYAKILSKFIRTINQDYINYQLSQGRQPPCPQQEQLMDLELPEQDRPRNERREESRERKQFTRLQSREKGREESRDNKSAAKKRETVPNPSSARDNRSKNIEPPANNPTNLPKSSILPKTPSQPTNKIDKDIKTTKPAPPTPVPPPPNPPFPSHLPPSSGFNFGPAKPGDPALTLLPPQLQGYLSSGGLLNPNQLINLQMFQNMNPLQMRQMPMRFPPMDLMQQSYLPMNLNLGMMALMNMDLNNPQLRMMQGPPKEPINLFKEQLVVYNKKQPNTNKNIRQVYPLKRSAYHVAIAYKIYLDKLKKQGNSFEQLEDIDPTRNARRIKGAHPQGGKVKDQKKRK